MTRARARRMGLTAALLVSLMGATQASGAGHPAWHAEGGWSTICPFAHRAMDDPIVYPGQPGLSHMHDFIGNASTNAFTTHRTLLAQPQGECTRPADMSAYWIPTLERGDSVGADGEGSPVTPELTAAYYLAAQKDPRTIEPFPRGLKMIAGDSHATSPQGPDRASWFCAVASLNVRTKFTPEPQVCSLPMRLYAQVYFPDCSDGRTDSHDHMSHMAYATFDPQTSYRYRSCPADHPIPVPMLRLIVQYPPKAGVGAHLASGGIYSLHADFFEAWRGKALERLIDNCLQADMQCQAQPTETPSSGM